MKTLIIDDEPELKALDKGLDLSGMIVAKTVEEGISALTDNEKFDRLYLDHRLIGGTSLNILTWLSNHLDKVPDEILSCSFSMPPMFYPMVQALQASAHRKREV